ncbi:fatty acyl-AMP ligase [Streptomyces sp. NPDC091406]|uniref:fatty acyl-AMP ligase n=1 Tax=unclassified Streptomyces TaxID=2593676 RepID=UPI00382437ED
MSEPLALYAGEHGDRPAIAIVSDPSDPDSAQWLTYAQLDRAARVFAQELLTVCPVGSRVLLLQPTSAEFVAAVLGCVYAGMVAVPSSMPGRYQQDQRRVLSIAHDAQVGCVLTTPDEKDDVAAWAERHDFAVPVLSLRVDPTARADGFAAYAADRDTVAVLQYTSGSTSDPKGNVVTHGNLMANAASTLRAFPVEEGDRFGGWLPNYHDMGLMGLIFTPLLAGHCTVLMSPSAFLRRPRTWLQMIATFRLAVTAAPNFAYEQCTGRVSEDEARGLDLSGLKYAVSGSEPINARVLEAFATRFASAGFSPEAFAPCFGMAETTLLATAAPSRRPVVLHCDAHALERGRVEPAPEGTGRALVSCGESWDLEVRIVDPRTGEEIPSGGVGEIWLRGESVVQGYWRNDEATRAAFGQRLGQEEGFLRTGDLGALIGGELYVTGRIKEMMIFRGRNVYPHDVEDELRRHHQPLRDVVGSVVTVPAGRGDDERLVIIHEVRRAAPAEELAQLGARMRATVAREFGLHAGAVLIMRRGGVRRTTSGKVQRAVMRSLFLGGELRPLWADGYEPRAELTTSGAGEPS